MIRFIAVIFALAVATSAQAMSPAPLHQPDGMITQVRQACGPGKVQIKGICVLRTTPSASVRRTVKAFAFSTTETPPSRARERTVIT